MRIRRKAVPLLVLSVIALAGAVFFFATKPDRAGGQASLAARDDFSEEEWRIVSQLSPASLPAPPADPANRYADIPAAAALGQKLFFDTRFSGALVEEDNNHEYQALGHKGETGRVSCASCHVPQSGFVDSRSSGRSISLAAAWGRRRAPGLLDIGQARLLTWDGRHDDLYNQVFSPLESSVEMNSGRLFVAQQLARLYRQDYEQVFGPMPEFDNPAKFTQLAADKTGCHPNYSDNSGVCHGDKHGMPGDVAEYDALSAANQQEVTRAIVNFGKAIAAYERQLSCGKSRFDAWVQGDLAVLKAEEKRGLKLFIGRARCVQCHNGPYLSDQSFHNVGLTPQTVASTFVDDNDPGAFEGLRHGRSDPLSASSLFSDHSEQRYPPMPEPASLGAFKTPMLRCVSKHPSFMHTGHMHELEQVVAFFNRGGDRLGYLGKSELRPLNLSAQEVKDVTAFLQALDGPGPAPQLLQPAQAVPQ